MIIRRKFDELYVTALTLTPLMEVYIKNSLSKVISFALVFCIILTTTITGFASTTNINDKTQIIVTGENSFITDGEEYVIEKEEFKNITETKMYDNQKKLVGHMQYDQTTGQLFDLFNNEEIEVEVILNEETLRLMDADGYYYQGDYTINVGLIVGTAACILTLTTLGVPLGMATTAALAVTSWASSFFYIEGELWMKSDDTYDYVKKIESVYESFSGNNNKLAGPYTLLQKKAI